MFGEWQGIGAKILGFGAIVLLILGATLTSIKDKNDEGSVSNRSGIVTLVFTTVGYWIYSALPKLSNGDSLSIFFPQMLGIFCAALIYVTIHNRKAFGEKDSYLDAIPGAIYGFAALAYIYAAKANGVVTAYVLAQLNVVISTLGGLLILHEQKTSRELKFTLWGLVLIVVGSIVTAFI